MNRNYRHNCEQKCTAEPKSAADSHWKTGIALSLLLLLSVSVTRLQAQSLAMSPAQVVMDFKPGQPFRLQFSIANDGDASVAVRAIVTDFWYNQKNEKVFAVPGSTERSAANWVEFVPRQLAIPAHSTSKLTALVTPPTVVADGGHYLVVFVESKPELMRAATAESNAVYANIRLGALVLLNNEKTERYKAEMEGIKFTPPSANENMRLSVELANQSNTHIFPFIKLAILNSHREMVAKAESEAKRFLPAQRNTLDLTWGGTLSPGDYVALITVLYGKEQVITRELPFTIGETPPAK